MAPSVSSLQYESTSASQSRRSPKGGLTFRIRGVPLSWDKKQLQVYLEHQEPDSQPLVKSLASEVDGYSKTATVIFQSPLPAEKTSRPWNISLPESDNHDDDLSVSALPLRVDGAFLGITTLFAPPVEDHGVDIVAVSGLGGHAYGSFKDKNGNYMWLQDALPFDITDDDNHHPMARIMIYGHNSAVPRSNSVQDIDDLSSALHSSLLSLVQAPQPKPIILMGHSLGGLIIKKALINLSKSPSQGDQTLFRAIYGIVFFGVPHGGMDIASLIPMVGDGPNRPLVESIGASSSILDDLEVNFHPSLGGQGEKEVTCFYETEQSPTARQDEKGRWSMSGPPTILVTESSAVHCRSWENDNIHIRPIARSHSDIVKFGPGDSYYKDVRDRLYGLVQRAMMLEAQ
ncbi:hypothetical protein TRIATDRAFT_300808 [Trichoderma atroviride IMI 206040]|uniref:DUF676 domain-containing protein n=1 Tax=Hypocrea atroviridis (strain ATCC 20476 / IMI 206040) TaxID=452589 RepID=G9P2Q6_HYPAI|nr:uncharacterized protein TRIATDRAFT_300808 [Trichoderma atroviride IMI 206040]EHK42736.1 hypothetical protein TRIATDRAFT_300808 [Trichoderma atroviride IMI 206040]